MGCSLGKWSGGSVSCSPLWLLSCGPRMGYHRCVTQYKPRRRSWVLHLTQARQSATRVSRLEKARLKILAGKGLNDR